VRYARTYTFDSFLNDRWEVPASEVASITLEEKSGESTTWTVTLRSPTRTAQLYGGSSREDAERLAEALRQFTQSDVVRTSDRKPDPRRPGRSAPTQGAFARASDP